MTQNSLLSLFLLATAGMSGCSKATVEPIAVVSPLLQTLQFPADGAAWVVSPFVLKQISPEATVRCPMPVVRGDSTLPIPNWTPRSPESVPMPVVGGGCVNSAEKLGMVRDIPHIRR